MPTQISQIFGRMTLTILLLALAIPVNAQRVALLPMADLSRGLDGVNLPFTRVVEQSLLELGLDMVPHEQVMQIMAEHRLRSFNFLDSFMAQKLGKDLQCAVVLLGTVTELGGQEPALGLTFTALDTVVGQPIWSETDASSVREQVQLLAINQPKTELELAAPLLEKILKRLWGTVEEGGIPNQRHYQLAGMQLFPAYVRSQERIDAALKISFLHAQPVGIAVTGPAGKTYLQLDPASGLYQGQIIAPAEEGVYPLELVLEWGAGKFAERVKHISSFQVINHPPGLKIEVKKAQTVAGQLAFRSHVLVLPRILDLKPMARWALEIHDVAGNLLATQEYEGDLPERMVWEGRGHDGFLLNDGKYQITLHIWDLAGNQSSDSCWVVMQRQAPNINVEAFIRQGKRLLRISSAGQSVYPLEHWSLGLVDRQGETLLKATGVDLPQVFEVLQSNKDEKIYLNFAGEDCLGNRLELARKEIRVPLLSEAENNHEPKAWVPDF